MTTIETNGRTLVVVELLNGANGFAICNWENGYTVLDYQYEDGYLEYQILSTSKQEYKLIGLLSELTAEQCEPYAPKHDMLNCVNDKEKFVHLLGMIYCLDTTKPLLIIEKIK